MNAPILSTSSTRPDSKMISRIIRLMPEIGAMQMPGENLRYIRSRLPVLVLTGTSQQLIICEEQVRAAEGTTPAAIHTGPTEKKIILSDVHPSGQDLHLILRSEDQKESISFQVFSLLWNDKEAKWDGPSEARRDLNNGVLSVHSGSIAEMDLEGLLRVFVLAAQCDLQLDPDLESQIKEAFHSLSSREISRRAMHRSLKKIIMSAKPSCAFLPMQNTGVLDWYMPELSAGMDLSQNRYHKYDIFHHSVFACDASFGESLPVRLAALFHDLGKVDTRREQPNGESTFHNHEVVSARHTERIMRRFGFDPDTTKHVRFLVRNHMFHYTSAWTDRAVRRFMRKVKPDLLEDLIRLRLADRQGSGKRTALPRAIKDLIRHIAQVRAEEAKPRVTDLAIDGNDLRSWGLKPGPWMGDFLKDALARVESGELSNEREELQAVAEKFIEAQPAEHRLQEIPSSSE